ncbi:hypothetical protein M758_4G032100, partial [Ceratodon purpureus]
MNLWNELNQFIHDSNISQFSEDCWVEEEVQDLVSDEAKRINCRGLWPNISAEVLKVLKHLKRELEKEKDEREKYALALEKFNDLEEQLETEKNMRNEECQKYDAIVLDLRNQVEKQAEEIRRLWIENLATESDSVELEKCVDSNDSKLKSLICSNNDISESVDVNEQCQTQNFEAMESSLDTFKGIPDTKPIILKLMEENQKLLTEISSVKVSIAKALKSQKSQAHATKKEMVTKLEKIEAEKDKFRRKTKVFDEENKHLEEENTKLRHELSTLKFTKSKLTMELKDLDKEMEDLQENLKNLQCDSLRVWKEKVQKLEEECKDLRNSKNKEEASEIECEDLRDNRMKVEAHETPCDFKKKSTTEENEEVYQKVDESTQADEKECKDIWNDENPLEEECKSLREIKVHLEEECLKLRESVDYFDKECNMLREFKEKFEDAYNNNEFTANKSEVENLKCEIASLKDENVKLCENHQAALDKQWNVLQVDLKAFEAKVEELESECESIRRDHLSSMVENSELAREKDRILALYNEQKYNYEILETANECLQKSQEQKEAQRIKERNNFHASIDNLNVQLLELESTFCERLHQQAANYASCIQLNSNINGRETITLTRQEYEILLAEKAVMLQERDSAHKQLCSAEIQNFQLSASIECLRQEVPYNKQSYDEKETEAEVLLAQDVVNLRSMLNSLEEELKTANCEKNNILDTNTCLRKELNEVHEVLSHCEHENQNLSKALEEFNKRSSLEHIHSAASSLKEQLGKVSKEKDSIKEQLNKVIKEKEQLANVTNERDCVIFSLKEEIKKLENKKEESCSTFKTQLQDMEKNTMAKSHKHDEFIKVVKERDNIKKELTTVQSKLKSLNSKMSLAENDHRNKLKLWQEKQEKSEEKCKKIEIELYNTKEALAITKKMMQKDTEEAIKEKNDLELMAKKKIEDAHTQASQIYDGLLQDKQSLSEKLNIASKELNDMVVDKNMIAQELMECKEKLSLLQKENEELTNSMKEKDNLISTKIPNLTNEKDQLLAMVANLKMEKETIKNKIEQDVHREMFSIKTMLAATIKEKEELISNKEHLEKEIGDLHITMKSSNEQLILLSSQKDQLVHAKEIIINERDRLLEKISSFDKNEEIRLKPSDLKSNDQLNSKQEVCENGQCVDLKKDVKQIQLDEMKLQYDSANSILIKEKECLLEERNKLFEELSLLKKDNEIKHGKKEKRPWNFKGYKEEIDILLNEKEKLLASEASLKQQVLELDEKCNKNNSSLVYEKMTPLQNDDNLVREITSLKNEKDELEKKLETYSIQNKTAIDELQNALTTSKLDLLLEQKEHAQLIEDHTQLKEENAMLIQIKDKFANEKNDFIMKIGVLEKENEDLDKKFKDVMNQLPLLRSKLSKLSSEKDQLVALESNLTQQLNVYEAKVSNQEQLKIKLEGEVIELNQTKNTLVAENDKLLKD